MILEDHMSAFPIVAPAARVNKPSPCHIAGCLLEKHDELAPTLHQGITKYSYCWTVDAMLDESEGEWGINAMVTYSRDLSLEESREFAATILLVTSWCEMQGAGR